MNNFLCCCLYRVNTEATDSVQQNAVLANLQEGLHRSTSGSTEPRLHMTLSKFGSMAFSDEGSSPTHSSVPSVPGSAHDAKSFQFDASPTPAATAAAAAASAGAEGETAGAGATAAVEAGDVVKSGTPSSGTHNSPDKTVNEPEEVRTESPSDANREGRATSNASAGAAEGDCNNGSAANSSSPTGAATKPKGPVKIVLKKRGSVVTSGPEERQAWDTSTSTPSPKLQPGMSPLPPGGNVRRMSTQTPRTPFNSTAHMSPAAAEIARAQAEAKAAADAAAAAAAAIQSAPAAASAESTVGAAVEAEAQVVATAVEPEEPEGDVAAMAEAQSTKPFANNMLSETVDDAAGHANRANTAATEAPAADSVADEPTPAAADAGAEDAPTAEGEDADDNSRDRQESTASTNTNGTGTGNGEKGKKGGNRGGRNRGGARANNNKKGTR